MSALPDQAPARPLLRYHGGKWRLAPCLIQHFPAHKTYTEVYGGGASVLLRKPRVAVEVYNDLDGEVCALYRVLRDPVMAAELVRQVELTPYAREEYEISYQPADDPLEQARRTLFRSWASHSSSGATGQWRTGFRSNAGGKRTPASNWLALPDTLNAVMTRLRGVVIENMEARDCLVKYDGPGVLHYIDPPYVASTRMERWAKKAYRYEMDDDDHRALAETVHRLKGAVVISGYGCPLYDQELYRGWDRYEYVARDDSADIRLEVVWIKPGVTPQMRLL